MIILMRKGAKWNTSRGDAGHLALTVPRAWEPQALPLPRRHLLAPAGKVKADPKATIPNLCVRTTETRAYAETRTREKPTEPFHVRKSREILAIVALLRVEKAFYTNLVRGAPITSFCPLTLTATEEEQVKSKFCCLSIMDESIVPVGPAPQLPCTHRGT